jgi:hypothetical protein
MQSNQPSGEPIFDPWAEIARLNGRVYELESLYSSALTKISELELSPPVAAIPSTPTRPRTLRIVPATPSVPLTSRMFNLNPNPPNRSAAQVQSLQSQLSPSSRELRYNSRVTILCSENRNGNLSCAWHAWTSMRKAAGLGLDPLTHQGTKQADSKLQKDIITLMNNLIDRKVYEYQPGRALDDNEEPTKDTVTDGYAELHSSKSPLPEFNESLRRLRQSIRMAPVHPADKDTSPAPEISDEVHSPTSTSSSERVEWSRSPSPIQQDSQSEGNGGSDEREESESERGANGGSVARTEESEDSGDSGEFALLGEHDVEMDYDTGAESSEDDGDDTL